MGLVYYKAIRNRLARRRRAVREAALAAERILRGPIEREMAWTRKNQKHDRFLYFELKAIGELVEQHREDFDRLVAALQAAADVLAHATPKTVTIQQDFSVDDPDRFYWNIPKRLK